MDNKNIIRAVVALVLAFVVGIGIAGLVWRDSSPRSVLGPTKTYENQELSLRFSYPEKYFLTEQTPNASTMASVADKSYHHQILLLKDSTETGESTPQNSSQNSKQNPPQNSIIIDVFKSGEEADIEEWVKENTKHSYFDLSDKEFETANVANKKIISYSWLPTDNTVGNTVALIHNGKIFLLSVSQVPTADDVAEDFVSVLSTVEFL